MLMAWLNDPTFNDRYWEVTQRLEYNEEMKQVKKPLTRKQMLDKYGESEMEEMVEEGLIQATCVSGWRGMIVNVDLRCIIAREGGRVESDRLSLRQTHQ